MEGRAEMDARAVVDIELDKVLDMVKRYSLSEEGRRAISPDSLTSDISIINARYIKIDTYMNYLDDENALDSFPSIGQIFEYVDRTHADISGVDIYKAGEFLSSYFKMLIFLKREDDILESDKELSLDILSSLDMEGEVNENHPRLLPLAKERDEIKAERYRYSSSYINANKALVQNTNPVYRNERVVIPIKADQKNSGELYIMGSSSSGATLFAEPFGLVDLNNKVVLAEEKIRAEKIRIKHELSERVRFLVPILRKMLKEVIDFDFHYAFALWAKKNHAEHPAVGNRLELIDARHPLLGDKAVPINLKLDDGVKVLVLSGANAGGKTVTMKTIALLSALNQICGFILASRESKILIFDDFLTDIGDGQSIEEAFSTFSSHMTNIARITRKSSTKSLVLLDELGSGTDPEEGASLSIAILKYMAFHSLLTITTSHYGQVKSFAYSEKSMMNASMEFNDKSSKPTFRILEGIPGDSHAISSAIRANMPKDITEDARKMISSGNETSVSIITSLLSKSRTLDRKISQEEHYRKELLEKIDKQNEYEEKLRARELELERIGYKELYEYTTSLRSRVEKLINDISTGELTKEKIKNAKAIIEESIEKEDKFSRDIKKKEQKAISKRESMDFNVGDDVVARNTNTRGRIIEKRSKSRYYVSFENGLRMDVDGSILGYANKEKKEASYFSIKDRKAEFVLDVRGRTLNESIEIIDNQIEAAILDGLSSFSIIHGYGDGILQKGINEYLRKRKEVKDTSFARPEDGGMGKTYVTLE